jgi:hypothetical protein
MSDHSGQEIVIRSLVVANVKEILAVSKLTMHRFHMKRLSLKKCIEEYDKKGIRLKSLIGSHLWKMYMPVDSNIAWEIIRGNIEFQPKRV